MEKKTYITPDFRVIHTLFSQSILSGNTEPISGGDDPDTPWE